MEAIGLKTAPVVRGSLTPALTLTGRVKAPDQGRIHLSSGISGRVQSVLVESGQTVTAGQALATIQSEELATHVQEYQEQRAQLTGQLKAAQAQVELAQSTETRYQRLVDSGIAPRKDWEKAQADLKEAQATLEQAKQQQTILRTAFIQRLVSTGLSQGQAQEKLDGRSPSGLYTMTAPASGVITQQDLSMGEQITPDQSVIYLVKLSPMWIEVDAFQERIDDVYVGQPAIIKTASGHSLSAAVSHIVSAVDPKRRVLPIRLTVSNSQGILKPGMAVSAYLELPGAHSQEAVLKVPRTAVVSGSLAEPDAADHQDHDTQPARSGTWVFRQSAHNPNQFQAVPVVTGRSTETEVEIKSGIAEGRKVVVSGARQLFTQISTQLGSGGIQSNHGHAHGPSGEHLEEPVAQGAGNGMGLAIALVLGLALGSGITYGLTRSRRTTPARKRNGGLNPEAPEDKDTSQSQPPSGRE